MLDQLNRVPPEWLVFGTVCIALGLAGVLFAVLVVATTPRDQGRRRRRPERRRRR